MRLSKYLKRLANDEARKKRNAFHDFMIENGWSERTLFMRGIKWVKDSDELIMDYWGWHWNGEIVPKEEVYQILGYGDKED